MTKITVFIHELTNKTQGNDGEKEREKEKYSRKAFPFQKKNDKWSPVVLQSNPDPLMVTSYLK